jgi:cation diffusion facilitator family transporter
MVTNNQSKNSAIRLVFMIGFVLMCLKFVAYFITESTAILTDALESIINVVAGAFAWYSVRLSEKPKDNEHPYGHGKIEFISAGFEGGLILMAALYILFESITKLIAPDPIHHVESGILICAAAGIVNFGLGHYLLKIGKKEHSPSLVADGKHLLVDTYSSVALVIGLLLVSFTNIYLIDPLVSIALAIGILITGYRLIRTSLAGLMDEADHQMLEQVAQVLNENRKDNWVDMHNLRIVKYGSQVHIDSHLTLPYYYDLEASHAEVTAVEKLVEEKFHSQVELFIHADPCLEHSCAICQLSNCAFRRNTFEKKLDWTKSLLLKNEKHQLN